MDEWYAIAVWTEGFVAASIGNHLTSRNIAWPWAYLIGGAAGIFVSNATYTCYKAARWLHTCASAKR